MYDLSSCCMAADRALKRRKLAFPHDPLTLQVKRSGYCQRLTKVIGYRLSEFQEDTAENLSPVDIDGSCK